MTYLKDTFINAGLFNPELNDVDNANYDEAVSSL